jgi:hypothetical protein
MLVHYFTNFMISYFYAFWRHSASFRASAQLARLHCGWFSRVTHKNDQHSKPFIQRNGLVLLHYGVDRSALQI